MQKNNLHNKDNPKKNSSYRYVDVGWRMLAMVLVGVAAGWFLDKQFPSLRPWGTLSLSVLAIIGSMYLIIKEVSKK